MKEGRDGKRWKEERAVYSVYADRMNLFES